MEKEKKGNRPKALRAWKRKERILDENYLWIFRLFEKKKERKKNEKQQKQNQKNKVEINTKMKE